MPKAMAAFLVALYFFLVFVAPVNAQGIFGEPKKQCESEVAWPYEKYTVSQEEHGGSYGHAAIDITAGAGATVLAPICGEVKIYIDGVGNTAIDINNRNYRATLLHDDFFQALDGQWVEVGTPIGTEGNNGNVRCGDGLHPSSSRFGPNCGHHSHWNMFVKPLGMSVYPTNLVNAQTRERLGQKIYESKPFAREAIIMGAILVIILALAQPALARFAGRALLRELGRGAVEILYDPKRKIQKATRQGFIRGVVWALIIILFTVYGPTVAERIVVVDIPNGPTIPVPKGWVAEGLPWWLSEWPPRQNPEVRQRIAAFLAGFESIEITRLPMPEARAIRAASAMPSGRLPFPYWNGNSIDFVADVEVWQAVNAATAEIFAEGSTCDPLLVLAVAHSESPHYGNVLNPSSGAAGTWQFMPGTFPTYADPGTTLDSRYDRLEAAKAACRMVHRLGLDAETTESGFVANFTGTDGSLVWNMHEGQARYVWRLWRWLRESLGMP